jgi:hypothetical protein
MTGSIKHILGGTIALAFAASVAVSPVGAATVLTFEGLTDLESVGNFYNGGTGGSGSGPGPSLGINFAPNAWALLDSDAGGIGNFGGEPSPSTVIFFNSGNAIEMNVAGGLDGGVSVYYTALGVPGFINVWDGFDASGNLLASLQLPTTPNMGAPDPTGSFSPFVLVELPFDGTALSVQFGGAPGQIAFDDITLGLVDTRVPLPGSLLLLAAGAVGIGLVRGRIGGRAKNPK